MDNEETISTSPYSTPVWEYAVPIAQKRIAVPMSFEVNKSISIENDFKTQFKYHLKKVMEDYPDGVVQNISQSSVLYYDSIYYFFTLVIALPFENK